MGNDGSGSNPAAGNGDDGNGSNLIADRLTGAAVIDAQGNRLGSVIDLYQEPKYSIAMLAKVILPDRAGFVMIPTATAVVGHDGIQVNIRRDALEGSPTLKSGRSTLVRPTRVRAIYEHYDIELPEALRKKTPSALRTGSRRRNRVTFPGEYLEEVLSGSMQAKMTQWPLS
jgi:hypothetical protein